MLSNIESQLPSIMNLPISLDDTLHFYFYLKTHVLIADVKVQYAWLVYSPMLIPRQLRFSLYSGAVITEGLM